MTGGGEREFEAEIGGKVEGVCGPWVRRGEEACTGVARDFKLVHLRGRGEKGGEGWVAREGRGGGRWGLRPNLREAGGGFQEGVVYV